MNSKIFLILNLVTTKLYFGKAYYLIKEEINKRSFQRNMGPGERVASIEIVFFVSSNQTKRIFPVTIICDLFEVKETVKTLVLIYGLYKDDYRYVRECVVLGPFIRYYNKKEDPRMFCEEFLKINIFGLIKSRISDASFEDLRNERIKTLIYRLIYEFRYFNNSSREAGNKLKNVRKNDWYIPVYFSKPINIKSLWLRLLTETSNVSSFDEFIINSLYILQIYYVTSIYEGGTFETKPDLILKSILKNDKKKEEMMDTILKILNDMALAHSAMELERRVIQQSIYVPGLSSDCEIKLDIFYKFIISSGQSSIKDSQQNKVFLLISDKDVLIPEFYFYDTIVLISKADFDLKKFAQIKIQFETIEGLLITKTLSPLKYGDSPILEDL